VIAARQARLAAAFFLASATLAGGTRADGGADTDRRAAVVARIESRAITVGELEDAMAAMPPFQRAMYGAKPAEAARAFLDDVLVRNALLDAAGPAAAGVDRALEHTLDRALSSATIRALRAAAGPASAIPMSDVRAYYDDNRDRYDAPQRILVWRILCKTREEAQSVITAALATPSPRAFIDMAREHSQDKATNLRGGNLGFLAPDGVSNEPGVRVDPAIVRAAEGVRDGDIVRTPVVESVVERSYFAVVWRRGTLPASKRAVLDAADAIRDAIWRLRIKGDTDRLVAQLRAARVRDLDVAPLDWPDVAELPPKTPPATSK